MSVRGRLGNAEALKFKRDGGSGLRGHVLAPLVGALVGILGFWLP